MLPATDHVARSCKNSSLDKRTGRPTPASFEFRLNDGDWHDTYLSVNWLEFLLPQGDFSAKLAQLRAFLLGDHGLPVIKPTVNTAFAVIPVADIHAAQLTEGATTLECRHAPQGDGDPHSGIYPNPGVDQWPANRDAAAHLAIQQLLFQKTCHVERGILAA